MIEGALALEAQGVVHRLGGARVLRGVDARFEPGSVHVVIGANGSGKSTLLSVLAGRITPARGHARLVGGGGASLQGHALREHVVWLGHEVGLYPDLTSLENVELHAALRALDGAAEWARNADLLGVGSARDRRVRELSRGQRQRIALVRTLVGSPAALLLDEPSTGLDSAGVERLAALLNERARRQVVIAITHDALLGDQLAGATWRLADGLLARIT